LKFSKKNELIRFPEKPGKHALAMPAVKGLEPDFFKELTMVQRRILRIVTKVLSIALLSVLAGCATLPRNPVPIDDLLRAEVVGAPGVRAFAGRVSAPLQEDIVLSLQQERPDDFVDLDTGKKRYYALALSGGGPNGAFGAGFLCGWTAAGNRPAFKLVTGISTGALIAPYAFLGSDYDPPLTEVFTTVNTKNVIEKYNPANILFSKESLTASTPLRATIDKHVDMELLDNIAEAHENGRRLYIGTTHMDAQLLVVWNMGKIATIRTDDALNLFRRILLASASVPVVMPPVLFNVEVDGTAYDEMHTDGSTATQLFFHAGTLDLTKAWLESGSAVEDRPISRLYVIKNGKLLSEPRHVPRNLIKISSRAFETTLKTATLHSLYRMYAFAQREQSELFYVAIPEDYTSLSKEPFDPEEMNRLFNLGFRKATSAEPWQTSMPGLAD
jgi:hypothetical protein